MTSVPTCILGISALYHDSAACLLRDGELVAAAEEERFSRCKGDDRFPAAAVAYCLQEAGIDAAALDCIAYYDKPVLTFSRLLQTYLEYPFRSYRSFQRAIPLWINQKLKMPHVIDEHVPGFRGDIFFSRHHESHAASAFFCSPFEEAAIVVADGVGEWATTSIGEGRGNTIRLRKELRFPHSIGLFYSAMTQYLGFDVNVDEYKVMGLAPYGVPQYLDRLLGEVLDLKEDGSVALNLKYFDYPHALTMINDRLTAHLGHAPRRRNEALEQFHMDLAASVQHVTTEAMLRLARTARTMTGRDTLCLAGGVALNCVANGAIYQSGLFRDIYVQPAAGDAGGAIGAALAVWHQVMGQPRKDLGTDRMHGAYLGPRVETARVLPFLDSIGAEYIQLTEEELPVKVATWLAAGHVVGFCHGRMEFGPRALGARSILGDPRDPANQSRINLKIKYRESFRPFAPAVLEHRVKEYFDITIPSPYMLMVMPLRAAHRRGEQENAESLGLAKLRVVRSSVPAVTHVDYSVRLQTVTEERNGIFYRIIHEFDRLTGCPMIVNTSFNVRGEPIVCDHEDALRCFYMTGIDILVLDTCVLVKPGVNLEAPPRREPLVEVPGGAAC
jgi:carbamoyltransferase